MWAMNNWKISGRVWFYLLNWMEICLKVFDTRKYYDKEGPIFLSKNMRTEFNRCPHNKKAILTETRNYEISRAQ